MERNGVNVNVDEWFHANARVDHPNYVYRMSTLNLFIYSSKLLLRSLDDELSLLRLFVNQNYEQGTIFLCVLCNCLPLYFLALFFKVYKISLPKLSLTYRAELRIYNLDYDKISILSSNTKRLKII